MVYAPYHIQYYANVPVQLLSNPMAYDEKNCLQPALQLIQEAVYGEREDELFYQALINLAPTQDDKAVIATIRDDEQKHNQMFQGIYKNLTGQDIQVSNQEKFENPNTYINGLQKALFGEWQAVEKYRFIKRCLPQGVYQEMLFEIITDELKHASKYNYLLTINSTKGKA